MADDALERLGKLAVDLCCPKLREKYGDVYVRDAEIMGLAVAATLATVTANPDVVLRALGGEPLSVGWISEGEAWHVPKETS